MKVGIVGSGDVGQALGRGFASRGHDVMIGSRSPDSGKLKAWVKETKGKGRTGSFADAAAHGELLVIATRGDATEDAVRTAGTRNFSGKVVIDVANPLASSGGQTGLFVGLTDSLGERVQKLVPDAKVVKAFNTVPSTQMVNPEFSGGKAELLICGNDPRAKRTVTKLAKDFGWAGTIDVGGIEDARWLEALVPLWVRVGGALKTWDHAFKVVRP